jgi:hypothetical protein
MAWLRGASRRVRAWTSLTQIGTFELQMSMVPYCTARNVFVHAGGAPLTKLEADGGDRRTMCP